MRVRGCIRLASIIAATALPLVAHAHGPMHVSELVFVGLPSISGAPGNIAQTALKTGDTPTFRVLVHSIFADASIVSVDLSELGVASPVSVPADPASGTNQQFHYDYGPFIIGPDVSDGLKTVSATASRTGVEDSTLSIQVLVDSILPTVSVSDISFSTTSPAQSDYFYLNGSASGTGSTVTVAEITETLLDAEGNTISGTARGYDAQTLTDAITSSPDGSFSQISFQLSESTPGEISLAESFKLVVRVYDAAGNFASTTLTVAVPRASAPDPCAGGACASNVLFLPGIEGSRLYEGTGCGKAAEEKLWEPLGDSILSILRGAGDQKATDLFLNEDGGSACSDIYVKSHDIIDSVGGSNIYQSLIDEMDGLKADTTITDWKPVAYDWRLSLDDLLGRGAEHEGKIFYAEATSTPYIEQTLRALAASSKTGKVTIIAHSNGGLVAKALLQQLGSPTSKSLVDKMIMVGVPQTGAPVSVGALLYGYDQGISSFGIPILHSSVARSLAQNSPMAYHLLPSEDYLESTAGDADHPIARFAGDAYAKEIAAYGATIANRVELADFLLAREGGREKPLASDVDSAEILNSDLVDYGNSTHATLDSWTPPEGIEMYQIAGWGVDTVAGIDFFTLPSLLSVLTAAQPVRSYRPIFTEDGDGTVPIPSALAMAESSNVKRYWIDLHSFNKLSSTKRKHADLFEIESVRDLLTGLLENSTSSIPSFISLSQPPPLTEEKILTFFLHSPLTLSITDSSGNVTGLAADDSITQQIPDSTYGEFGEVKYVTVPEGGSYQLVMAGQEEGTFTLEMQESSGGVVIASSTIANVPTTPSTEASLTVTGGLETASDLVVDENGDGSNEFTITPQIGGQLVNYESTPGESQETSDEASNISTTSTNTGRSSGTARASDISTSIKSPITTTAPIDARPAAPVEKKNLASPATTSIQEVGSSTPQLASVYSATSQQPIFAQVRNVIYNGFYRLWTIFKSIF